MMPDNSRSHIAMTLQTMTPPPPDSSQVSIAADQLLKTVSDLNIARKNRMIYPEGHANVQRSLLQAHQRIETILEQIGQLTLSTANETLLVANQCLDARNNSPKEMADVLKKHAIAALAFDQGLQHEELGDLLGVLVRDPEDIRENGGISECVKPSEFSHTHVYPLDYSSLEITEEEEIARSDSHGKTSVWDRFVKHLYISSALGKDGDPGLLADPISLAGMLNHNHVDSAIAVESYEQLLRSQFKDKNGETGKADQLGDEGIAYFNDLMNELHPNLREQFLSVTFDHCAAHDDDPAAKELLDGLGKDLAVEMLRYAKTDGKQISPSLLSLIQKIGHLPLTGRKNPATAISSDELSSIEVGSLLRSENYDHFIDQNYSEMLKGLAGSRHQAEPIEALAGELLQELEPNGVDSHIGRALIRLMAVSGDSRSYRDWTRHLMQTMDDLVDDGAFACLTDIFVFISKEDASQKDSEKKRIAGFILQRFCEPQFINQIMTRIGDGTEASVTDGAALLKHIGNPALSGILDSLSHKENAEQTSVSMDLLAPFGRRAAEEAEQRLNDPRPGYLCLMVQVICRFGDAEMAEGMRHLLGNEHRDVRLEVLGALLKHKNGWGMVRVRALVKTWSEETRQALELVGRYKIREAVPLLVSYLQRWASASGQFELFMAILETLGRIGDSEALPALNKLARKRWSLAPGRLRQLQRGVFYSLEGYPYASVVDLIHFGLNHKDQSIKIQCAELMKAYRSGVSSTNTERDKKVSTSS
jgi:hypothetical protein